MQGQNIRQKVQIVISGAFSNTSVHFVGVIIVCTDITIFFFFFFCDATAQFGPRAAHF
jgi:hypothetical protein